MKPTRIFAALVAGLAALVAIGLLVAGGALLWLYGTQRDADGFLTSPAYHLATDGYALVSNDIDLASRPGDWFPSDVADVRLAVDAAGTFVGIGPTGEVETYLAGVAGARVTRLGSEGDDVRYEPQAGTAVPARPADQPFWVAAAVGEPLEWAVEAGSWTVVVMNADASAGVAGHFTAAVRLDFLAALGAGLALGGVVLALLAAAGLLWATREQAAQTVGEPMEGPYPLAITGAVDQRLHRVLWLVKWLLAVPHLVVLAALWLAYGALTVVAFFAILFTGRYPRGIFAFNVGVLRWSWRVGFYAFSPLATDRYPPFTLADADYPARLSVDYPAELSRGKVVVKWWLLAIPHYVVVGVLAGGLMAAPGNLEIGLIGVLVLIAAVALAFTGRYSAGLFELVMGLNRWVYRVIAYASLMTDEYPPFRLDMGGAEPPSRPGGDPGGAGPEQAAREPLLTGTGQ